MIKLLIVDDSNIIRRKIQRVCDPLKYKIIGLARSGEEALTCVDQQLPQLVTMDITMPGMGGVECVEQIMKRDASIRILVISALSDVATGIEALEKGARGFLCKPFSDAQLSDALTELLEESYV